MKTGFCGQESVENTALNKVKHIVLTAGLPRLFTIPFVL